MKLYPAIRPYKKGFLDVGSGHSIYYELVGNPKGKPVMYVHGGPGTGCDKKAGRFFNPRKFNVILFDQRGAGRSRPFASTKSNTTQKLVADMSKLLDFLNVSRVFLFGGSWGSTLSLVYAIKNPKRVSGMLLRGIFLATKDDTMYTFGGGASDVFPDAWERFSGMVPKKHRKDVIGYYVKKMKSPSKKVARKYAYEWAWYELSMLKLEMRERDMRKAMKNYNYFSLGMLEAYYLKNRCFIPEGYILRNAKKLKMPVSIIHGRYDSICRPLSAWQLHKALPRSKLKFVLAGHGSSDSALQDALLREMNGR